MDVSKIQDLMQLQECISVLFTFKRYGVLEVMFSEDVDSWLKMLVSLWRNCERFTLDMFQCKNLAVTDAISSITYSGFNELKLIREKKLMFIDLLSSVSPAV